VVISARMLAALRVFYPSVCTIQTATLAQDSYGEPTPIWSDLADHAELMCRLSPAGERETRRLGLVVEETTHVAALAGYYPTVTPAMRAVVDGMVYDITGVRSDGQGMTTWLGMKRVTATNG